jgi:Tol biopolymer transport system component
MTTFSFSTLAWAGLCLVPLAAACGSDDPFGPGDQFAVVIASGGVGGGTISIQPGNRVCLVNGEAETGFCAFGVRPGTVVTLTATPAEGQEFAGWGDDCAHQGLTPHCSVKVTAPISVTAAFLPELVQDIVYQSTAGGISELWILRARTSTPTRVFPDGVAGFDPAASPVGQIAFMRPGVSGRQEIWMGSHSGAELQRWSPPGVDDGMPAFSPDGQRMAFVRKTPQGGSDIWVANLDGTGLVNLTAPLGPSTNLAPAWSPDGYMIAFAGNRNGQFRIWVMGANGNHPTELTSPAAADLDPSWSPDSRKLVFVGQFADGDVDLLIRDMTTQQITRIALPGEENRPAWSPRGTRIAFASDRDGDMEIYTMAPDGTELAQVTHNTVNDLAPAWLLRR